MNQSWPSTTDDEQSIRDQRNIRSRLGPEWIRPTDTVSQLHREPEDLTSATQRWAELEAGRQALPERRR